jgi:hypothetical protein
MGLTIVAITESVDASLALVHDDKNEGKSVFFEQVSFENFRSFCWFPVFFRIMAGHLHTLVPVRHVVFQGTLEAQRNNFCLYIYYMLLLLLMSVHA